MIRLAKIWQKIFVTIFFCIFSNLNIYKNIHILLYAPTFRDKSNRSSQKVNIDIDGILKILNNEEEKWVCLVRAHSLSKGLCVENRKDIIDVSLYPDMSDLLLISDILITDILTLFDIKDYNRNCRSFNFDLKESKFIKAFSQSELDVILQNIDNDKIYKTCDDVI